MPSAEIQTDAIVRHALSQGKHVFIPYLHKSPLQIPDTPSRVMDMVLLEGLEDYESLQPEKWGIPSVDPATVGDRQRVLGEPGAHSDKVSTLDLMLLPGVAFDFDASGGVRRLGHGMGFYDFFLNRYLAQHGLHADDDSSLQLWGLSLSEQLLSPDSGEEVPMGLQDRRLHGLLLGNGQVRESGSNMMSA
jgi:5-formyltetrahydrofolate cyclo-ligase